MAYVLLLEMFVAWLDFCFSLYEKGKSGPDEKNK
jgi:hypothetical protein